MNKFRLSLLAGVAALLFLAAAPRAQAQVSFGVNIGAAPVCPYGYYGYAPYNCAPYGYYGPDWFTGGVFIGAGPWYHGRPGWFGPVNHDFDPRYGYHGPFPGHADHFDRGHNFHDFHGNDWHGTYGEGHHEGFHGGYHPR
jgi:hypothetical protein